MTGRSPRRFLSPQRRHSNKAQRTAKDQGLALYVGPVMIKKAKGRDYFVQYSDSMTSASEEVAITWFSRADHG